MPKINNKYDRTHLRNMALMDKRIKLIYSKAAEEAAKIGVSLRSFNPDKMFSFDDYPETKKMIDELTSSLHNSMEAAVVSGVRSSWTLSNNKNNALSQRVFGDNIGKLTKEQYARYFSSNGAALDAFLLRKQNGLNLSERVWRYTNDFRNEIEMGLDLGIRSGKDAPAMARELKQYLQYPDKLFRRVRDEHGQLQLSKAAAEFHPGRGVYRSSYKNARRLASTEINMAYQTSDYLRWQQMDFVVGIEVKTSNNHTLLGSDGKPHEFLDICDALAGKYPKDFKFTGWHPHCRCHAEPILKTEEEMDEDTDRILKGEDTTNESENKVEDVPQAFKDHVLKYGERIENTAPGRLPYYIQDNRKRVDKLLGLNNEPQRTPQEIAAERHANRTEQDRQGIQQAWNESRLNSLQEAINNGYLPEECKARLAELAKLNTPAHFAEFKEQIKTLSNAASRHAARSGKEIDEIKEAWVNRPRPRPQTLSEMQKVLGDKMPKTLENLQSLIDKFNVDYDVTPEDTAILRESMLLDKDILKQAKSGIGDQYWSVELDFGANSVVDGMQVRFKKDKVTATFSLCDSLYNKGYIQPTLTTDPGCSSVAKEYIFASNKNITSAVDATKAWAEEYIELQYHGDLTVDCIESVFILPETLQKLEKRTIDKMLKAGFPIWTTDETGALIDWAKKKRTR